MSSYNNSFSSGKKVLLGELKGLNVKPPSHNKLKCRVVYYYNVEVCEHDTNIRVEIELVSIVGNFLELENLKSYT